MTIGKERSAETVQMINAARMLLLDFTVSYSLKADITENHKWQRKIENVFFK